MRKRYRYTSWHKSLADQPSRLPLVPVDQDGYRDLTLEGSVGSELLSYSDPDPVVRLDLSAEGLEFLLENLPEGDGFTQALEYRRELARFTVWDREVGR